TASGLLAHGDRLTFGAVEIVVHIRPLQNPAKADVHEPASVVLAPIVSQFKEQERETREQREAERAAERTCVELEDAQRQALEIHQQLPELELRAEAAVERLARAREQLGEHLAKLRACARQSQEEVEALRSQAQLEAEQARQQRLAVQRARDDHRLAVAAFR